MILPEGMKAFIRKQFHSRSPQCLLEKLAYVQHELCMHALQVEIWWYAITDGKRLIPTCQTTPLKHEMCNETEALGHQDKAWISSWMRLHHLPYSFIADGRAGALVVLALCGNKPHQSPPLSKFPSHLIQKAGSGSSSPPSLLLSMRRRSSVSPCDDVRLDLRAALEAHIEMSAMSSVQPFKWPCIHRRHNRIPSPGLDS
eukprot:1158395-Pelagomonas_calceolata.AAC.2